MDEEGARTLGEFLLPRETKRVRMDSENQEYDFYPQRKHYEEEFDAIWSSQATHHPSLLTAAAGKRLKDILFYQRPLKEQPVGVCTFLHDEFRLPRAHPLFQDRRLYEEVNHLEITTPGAPNRKLTLDERDRLILKLRGVKSSSFDSLGKLLKLEPGQSFNKATETRTALAGNEVYAAMADKKRFGAAWAHFDRDRQWQILENIIEEQDPEVLHAFLTEGCGLDEEHAQAAAKVSLPELYGRLGQTATARILDELKKEVITYDEAVRRCGWHHSDDRTGEILKKLPYYGELLTREIPPGTQVPTDPPEKRWGKITNPTVHIGLRQVEKLVNAIIAIHGRPDEIVVELARELNLNERSKKEHNDRIRRDTAVAQQHSRMLEAEGIRDNGANRALLKQWKELNPGNIADRRCPYCAEPIGMAQLFNGDAQIDHIVPYSRSLDDSAGNKVVAHRSCNQAKGNKTPWERWSGEDSWELISAQVARMHKSKQWRFGPDAMERFASGEFIARQLTDTQYLSRLAGRYLSSLYAPDEGRRVYVITGRMTAMLRRLWALNDVLADSEFVDNKHSNAPKNRLDHRHHAIDGFVCSMMSHSLLHRVATAAGRAEHKDLERQFEDLPEPWPGYLPELKAKLEATIVSHKPDHGRRGRPAPGKDVTAGQLHNDTAYGFTGEMAADGKTPIVVHRVPLRSLKPADVMSDTRIADPDLRDELRDATAGLSGKDFEDALKRFHKFGGRRRDKHGNPMFLKVRRVRVREPLNVIPIRDASGKAYKGYKGDSNARFDVWRLPNGKWVSDIVSMFDAHQPADTDRRPHPAAKKVLSLRQNDMLAIERDGTGPREFVRVVKFSTIGVIALANDNEAGPLKARDASKEDRFKYVLATAGGLKKHRARQIRINPLGRVSDPGPR